MLGKLVGVRSKLSSWALVACCFRIYLYIKPQISWWRSRCAAEFWERYKHNSTHKNTCRAKNKRTCTEFVHSYGTRWSRARDCRARIHLWKIMFPLAACRFMISTMHAFCAYSRVLAFPTRVQVTHAQATCAFNVDAPQISRVGLSAYSEFICVLISVGVLMACTPTLSMPIKTATWPHNHHIVWTVCVNRI